MPIIFKAKTREGYAMKVLSELLQNNLKSACFDIDETGIGLRMMDQHRTILIDLRLDADKFSIYKYKNREKMLLSVNLTHFHRMLKAIKKRDSIELSIDDENPHDLVIKIIPKEQTRVTTSQIKILPAQNIDIETLYDGSYGKSIIITSSEFQKMCKGLSHISPVTHICAKGFLIRFSSDAGGVMKRYTDFGEAEDSEDDIDKATEFDYDEEFDTEQLSRITKLAGLSTTMQIYPKKSTSLLLKSTIGSIGEISIYLKPKSIQEREKYAEQSDEE